MAQIFVENPRMLVQNKRRIEKAFRIKFSIKDSMLEVKSKPEDEAMAYMDTYCKTGWEGCPQKQLEINQSRMSN